MRSAFDYFIVLAGMRTGSNLLEAGLNALDGVTCHGEAFNPHFIGYPKNTEVLGFDMEARDANPDGLITAMRDAPDGLHGFRFFHSHDPRALALALDDPRCAKIILNRNPLDSYISLKIARETQQWKLTNVKQRRSATVSFNSEEFREYLEQQQGFQLTLLRQLQKTGQSAFHIGYDDLQHLETLNGLAAWLGVHARLDKVTSDLKPQNPAPALSKVNNPEDMETALSGFDGFNLHRTPNFEPRRGPAVSHYVVAPHTPLMFLPVRGGPENTVRQWMAKLDATDTSELITERSHKQVRMWMKARPGHRKFTVLRHPLARAHSVFCDRILGTGPGTYAGIRNKLRNQFKLPIPGQIRDQNYSRDQHYEAFSAFLAFLQLNLRGQTPIRVDGSWSTQTQILEGIASFALPDLILREDEILTALPSLAKSFGHESPPTPEPPKPDVPFTLSQIYDADLEALAAETYQRDYLQYGFEDWIPVTDAK
ncbi:MAG: nodulation protein NodH [Ruegeria sp.]